MNMLDATRIRSLFEALNERLKEKGARGEIGICGGAVMCLVFQSRRATKDIDGIFQPAAEIREAARLVARDFDLPENWLNDGAKSFFHSDPPKQEVLELSNLRVWAPSAPYMLAMKCVSARFDSTDREDVEFLLRWLKIRKIEQAFEIICEYYPRKMVPAKTQFLLEEILAADESQRKTE